MVMYYPILNGYFSRIRKCKMIFYEVFFREVIEYMRNLVVRAENNDVEAQELCYGLSNLC